MSDAPVTITEFIGANRYITLHRIYTEADAWEGRLASVSFIWSNEDRSVAWYVRSGSKPPNTPYS